MTGPSLCVDAFPVRPDDGLDEAAELGAAQLLRGHRPQHVVPHERLDRVRRPRVGGHGADVLQEDDPSSAVCVGGVAVGSDCDWKANVQGDNSQL